MDAIKGSTLRLCGALGLALCSAPLLAADDPPLFPPGTFFAVDVGNRLERFNVAAPGERLSQQNITGLMPGEDVQGLDFRPATGELYAVGSTSQLYRIDPLSAVATRVGTPFSPTLDGVWFGVDFNPAVDRLRVVSSNDQNLRLHPDTGAVVLADGVLNPSGDVMGAAYINNFHGATVTTLYDLDSTSNQLLIQSPPNNGLLTPVGPLGIDFEQNGGFDVAPGGTAYAALGIGAPPWNLYTINLANGAATLVGPIGSTSAGMRSLAFPAGRDLVYGVTLSNRLVKFRSGAPGTLLRNGPISGLQPGENVLGIDFRPATGELYGLGSTSRLYRIDPATGVATQVGAGPFTPALSGTDFGFDFNPSVDRIRVVSDAEQNLRLHPDTGAVVGIDTNLTPAGNVVAAAYTNNFAGTATTTLYDIDSGSDLLLIQSPPNNGVLTVAGTLGVDAGGFTGFDIGPSGNALASITAPGATVTGQYAINLSTGAATLLGNVAGEVLRDIAVRLEAEVAYAVLQQAGPSHTLIAFNTGSPGLLLGSNAITGLQAGEAILGIDVRPATGELFALGSTSRIYRLDPVTGVATQAGSGPLATPLSGGNFGFDFNPAVDRIRIVSDAEQNLRINPFDLAVTVDGALVPAGNVAAAAYSNNYDFPAGTTLYDIDAVANTLLMQNPPNSGTLVTVGPLGIVLANANIGFDIGSITGYAYLASSTAGAPQLHRVNLTTGAATLIGNINGTGTLVGFAVAIDADLTVFANGFE